MFTIEELQPMIELTADAAQSHRDAFDCLPYHWLTVQLHVVSPAAGTLHLEHSATPEDDAFVSVATFTLGGAGHLTTELENLARYVRWRVVGLTGTTRFAIHLLARDGSTAGGPTQIAMQPLAKVNAGTTLLPLDRTVDVGRFGSVMAVVRVASASSTGGTLKLQTSPVERKDFFHDISGWASVDLAATGSTVIDLTGLHSRYLRWHTLVTAGGNASFSIDLVCRHTAPEPLFTRLQELRATSTVVAGEVQDLDEAVDIGDSRRVIATFKVGAVDTAGSVRLQHSAVLEETAFVDATGSVSLTATGTTSVEYTDLLRFVRWKTENMDMFSPARFIIDLVGRSR